ncbi:MAG: hypothetical protein IPF98_13440 [Gemmatimonadetes bacterium]|nr:hypothetical protein [Gemmatimonadota bacterium]
MNLTQGIMVGANAVLDLRNFTGATITSQGTLTNQGTVAAVAACGNCGTGNVINADIINQGTLHSAAMVALGKVNGAVENSGAITFGNNGEITIPATAGNPTFSQNGGSITGNGNFTRLNMLAGTFTMNGGKARQRLPANKKPVVILDGANLVMTAGATDSAVIGVLARSATTPTIAGDVRALTTLWLGGSVDGQPGSVAFTGNPTNLGTITTVRQIDTFGGQLTIAGSGRLTNAGMIDQSLNSGAQAVFTFTIEVTNSGTHKLATSSGATFSKVGGSYVNTGTIDMTASVAVLTILGSTLTSTGIITGGSVRVDAGGRLKATGSSPTTISPINGGVVEPGLSLGSPDRQSIHPRHDWCPENRTRRRDCGNDLRPAGRHRGRKPAGNARRCGCERVRGRDVRPAIRRAHPSAGVRLRNVWHNKRAQSRTRPAAARGVHQRNRHHERHRQADWL